MVSSIGSTWIRAPYLMSAQGWTETTSPRRTRRFCRTTLLILILESSTESSARTIKTVSLLFFPFNNTVSPLPFHDQHWHYCRVGADRVWRKNKEVEATVKPTIIDSIADKNTCTSWSGSSEWKLNLTYRKSISFSIVAVEREQTELSSFVASSTMSLLGEAFFFRIAVASPSSLK